MKPRISKLSKVTKPRRSRADRAVAKTFMSLLKSGSDTRIKKVKRLRQAVRTKSYENALKLSIALDRLTRDLSA